VLLSRAGDVKLSDFGVAFAEGRLEKTVGGIARGKPAYMAPEQAVRGPMDGRTDVFALGCVLHALFTGQSALRDENALVDLLAGVTLPLEVTLPADVREVIARAVQRDKHARYESAEAFALACAALVPKYSISEPRTELANWVRSVVPELVLDKLNQRRELFPIRAEVALVHGFQQRDNFVGAVARPCSNSAAKFSSDVALGNYWLMRTSCIET
jgi:serine/threonine protein kinase